MPPYNRHRQKRTVYLGAKDEAAIKTIRQSRFLRTNASAIRFAVRETERRITKTPSRAVKAMVQLIECVEALPLLSEPDRIRLNGLCRRARTAMTKAGLTG